MTSGRPSALFGPRRRIMVVSPQPWAGFKVSKHHYAIELAALGHEVFFVEPPVAEGPPGQVRLAPTDVAGVTRVTYRPWFPYRLKFHALALFDRLMRRQARMIAAATGAPDIVWDFDNEHQFADLRPFGATLRVFHAVDDIRARRRADKHAHLVLSVAQAFLDRIAGPPSPRAVIPHAIQRAFERYARDVRDQPVRRRDPTSAPCVALVANLGKPETDWASLARMATENPEVLFRLIGPCPPGKAEPVEGLANVRLEGLRPPEWILETAPSVDVWLMCYDPRRTANAGTNSHKLLEYLATGAPVLTNRVAAYEGSDLVEMPDTFDNAAMPELLKKLLADLPVQDSPERRLRRAEFALGHTYAANLVEISRLMDQSWPSAIPPQQEG